MSIQHCQPGVSVLNSLPGISGCVWGEGGGVGRERQSSIPAQAAPPAEGQGAQGAGPAQLECL